MALAGAERRGCPAAQLRPESFYTLAPARALRREAVAASAAAPVRAAFACGAGALGSARLAPRFAGRAASFDRQMSQQHQGSSCAGSASRPTHAGCQADGHDSQHTCAGAAASVRRLSPQKVRLQRAFRAALSELSIGSVSERSIGARALSIWICIRGSDLGNVSGIRGEHSGVSV